jgi:phosphoenolpyruvate carboxykinase (ATP)
MPTRLDAPPTGPELYRRLHERVRWNLPVEALVRAAVDRGEGVLSPEGALCVDTRPFTGRSPADKYTVRRPPSEARIDWESRFNQPMSPEKAEQLALRFLTAAERCGTLHGFRGYVGRGTHRRPIAVVTELAWHSLMARHLFVRPEPGEPLPEDPHTVLLFFPSCRPEPGDGGDAVIVCDLENRLGLIGGTSYGGEQKKFLFYLLNYLLPQDDVFPMHCSAGVGRRGDVSVLFGLSGTGKTTLSADPERRLIGDDEHGWDEDGVFNFEGGCYAKLFRLTPEGEPLIWRAVNRPGSLLENVAVKDGRPDFADDAVENTRGAYPLDALPSVEPSGRAGHPSTVVFLTFDASGTLPPLSLLDETQALYWFLAGYTARVAGTERGMGDRPEPTFSACFGAPFLACPPRVYVELLRDRLRRHRPLVVLMNTGAAGGVYGHGGTRTPLEISRRLLTAAQSGALRSVPAAAHPQFRIRVPAECEGVPPELLDPRRGWPSGAEYDAEAARLAAQFHERVTRRYAGAVSRDILDAGPQPA